MSTPGSEPELFRPPQPAAREPRSAVPWIIALGVVVIAIGVLVAVSHRGNPPIPAARDWRPPILTRPACPSPTSR